MVTISPTQRFASVTRIQSGFSETFSFFPQGVTHDPVSGTDS